MPPAERRFWQMVARFSWIIRQYTIPDEWSGDAVSDA